MGQGLQLATMQHSKAHSLNKALAKERYITRGMREDIADVQNGLTNYQTNVTARLDLFQHELNALKLQQPMGVAQEAFASAAAPAADYFDGGQHDCQEVLRVMMDLLHDDLVSSWGAGTAWNRRSLWYALPVVMVRWRR